MKISRFVLVGTLMSSASFAQQPVSGTVTEVDRINRTVAIRPIQSGTSGAAPAAPEQFKVQGGLSLETVHAGDRVTVSVTETGGVKTITKVDKP
jgi:Cu/Ag efflux protein CusF